MSRIRQLLFNAALRISGNTLRDLEALRNLQWLPRERLEELQRDRLVALLQHAWSKVPYYRSTLDRSGVVSNSGEVRLDRFEQLPLLDKVTLHDHYDELKSEDLDTRKWYPNASGGSTGETAHFIQDLEYGTWGRAIAMLFDDWVGYQVGEPRLVLWPVRRDIDASRANTKKRLAVILRNESWTDARLVTLDQMRAYLSRIRPDGKTHLYGHPENLYDLARFAGLERIAPNPPASIVTGGANLFSWMRPEIEQVFRSQVFDRYGSREARGLAGECNQHAGLHVCMPSAYFEILRQDGTPTRPGELGEVVVTTLRNYSMPLLRYRIGDLAAWSDRHCACGRQWPLLEEIAGRTRDLFRRRDGSRVRITESTFSVEQWIWKFQVIQEDYDLVRARLVPHANSPISDDQRERGIERIRGAIRDLMGEQCTVEVTLTDHIDASASGKFRHHICLVD